MEERVFVTPSGKKIEVQTYSSPHHMEVSPSDMGPGVDRVVIQDLIKEFSSTPGISGSKRSFKVAIVLEAHCLSRDAQNALRRTMERCSRNVRFVFIADQSSSIFAPLKSRCLCLRCPAVDEGIYRAMFPTGSFHCHYGSLRRNVLSSEYPDVEIKWESNVEKIVSLLMSSSNFQPMIAETRPLLYQIIQCNVPKHDLIKSILLNFLKRAKVDINYLLLVQIVTLYVIFLTHYL
jgi:hypothetical protein